MLWRLSALAGGVGGFASLALPYALVSGGTLGLDLREESHTLFELARLVADAGEDPQLLYLLIMVVVAGSTLALVGALLGRWVAFGGGLLQGASAALFAYGATTQGSQTFLFGLGQVDLTLQVGVFVLAGASVLSVASLPVGTLSRAARSAATGS